MKDEHGNPLVLPDDIALDMVNIIYTMKLTEYQKYETTTVATNVKEETMMRSMKISPISRGYLWNALI